MPASRDLAGKVIPIRGDNANGHRARSAFCSRNHQLCIVFAIGGIYILTHPLLAINTLTVLLAVVIFLVGVFDIITYFRMQRESPSGWMLVNGIAAVILGALIWVHWPSSSAWAIGTLVGVNLLLTGITRLMFGVAGRKLVKDVAA